MAAKWLKARQTKYGAYIAVLHSGRPRYSGGGEFSGQSLRQVLRRHQEQAVQPVRPDHQDRQGPEERRPHDLFRRERQLPERARSAGPLLTLSTRLRVDYIDPNKKPTVAKAAGYRQDSAGGGGERSAPRRRQEFDRREITGALIRAPKAANATSAS